MPIQVNIFKMIVALGSMASGVVLLCLGSVSETVGVNLISVPMAYILGNGVAAKNGSPMTPIVGSAKQEGIS